MNLHPNVLLLIESKLKPIINAGRDINRLVMYVPEKSELAYEGMVQTKYGCLVLAGNVHLTKGTSYILEDPGRPNRHFTWVRKRTEK